MLLAINRAGDVFSRERDSILAASCDHVTMLSCGKKKSDHDNDNDTYEVVRTWGHGRFGRIGGIVVVTSAGAEVICVCDNKCIQTFRTDGSFLHLFGMGNRDSRMVTGFASGRVYVAGEVEVFTLDRMGRCCFKSSCRVLGI